MSLSAVTSLLISILIAPLSIAFYTLLERKALGYIQLRKGPNKVGLIGIPQPFADAIKLFCKEQSKPTLSNYAPYLISPICALALALLLWSIFPHSSPRFFVKFRVLFFLCVSSLNVYTTLAAGWSSNSKYALLGALRGVAQTISYEVRMALILLSVLLILTSFNFRCILLNQSTWPALIVFPMFFRWYITTLAETNRTPFDFAEGESELVSGFNIEYSRGRFALIFIAEYARIIIISVFTTTLFIPISLGIPVSDTLHTLISFFVAFTFIWVRGTLPRIRYDRLIALTWKSFLPSVLRYLMLILPLSILCSFS